MTRLMLAACALGVFLLGASLPACGADLYANGEWPALAADRTARKVGDVLTVVIYESSAATNTASTGSTRSMSLGGHVSAGSTDESASLGMDASSDNSGSTGRSGGIVAQITVVVDAVLPNGDLHVAGEQALNINDERTLIRIKGRVRTADISGANVVLSSRLADAAIDYDGEGFVSRSARPGILMQIFTWLGIP